MENINLDSLDITKLKSSEVRDIIINRLSQINRKGIDNLLAYIQDPSNGYFTVQCHNHHRFSGGMARHVLGVYLGMRETNSHLPKQTDDDSLAIVGLLHDISDSYGCHFSGHGRASVALLKSFGLELLPQEEYAIRFHMLRKKTTGYWIQAFVQGAVSAPDSNHRLLFFMINDTKDAARYSKNTTPPQQLLDA